MSNEGDDSTRFTARPGASDETRFTAVGTPPPGGGPAHVTFPPGSLIGHTYSIEALLARGGMGEVYRARHIELNTEHALKIILPELANNQRIVDLFRREASVLRTIRHDAVVAYDGVSRDENGRLYLVMEFVDGPSLSKLMGNRTFTAEDVRQLRDRLADGLAVAHEKGVIHRDISPDNVILPGGDVDKAKIIDFGISKMADPEQKTIVGDDFAGKFSYVSPEQLGMFGGKVDGRSDIYSLGLVLAAAAQGEPLDMGLSPISVIEARRAVPDLSRVPAGVRDDLAAMLEPDPANRPQSMRALARPQEQRGGRGSTSSEARRRSSDAKAGSGRMVGVLGALAVLVAAGGAGGYWYWQNHRLQDDTIQQGDSGTQQNGSTVSNAGATGTQTTTGQAVQQSTTSTDAGQMQSTAAGTSSQDTGTGATTSQQQTSTGTTSSSSTATATDNQQASGSNSATSTASGGGSAATTQNTTTAATDTGGSQSQSQQTNESGSGATTGTSQTSNETADASTTDQQQTSSGSQSNGTTAAGGQQSSSSATTTTPTTGTTSTSTTTTQTGDTAASNENAATTAAGASTGAGTTDTGTQTALLPHVPDVAKLREDAARAVQGLSCAGVRVDVSDAGRIFAAGYVASEADRMATAQRLTALSTGGPIDNAIAVIVPPLCGVLDVLRAQTAFDRGAPSIDPGGADGIYRAGDHIKVVVTAPATSDGYIYVDSIEAEGRNVIHLLPNTMRTINRVKAGKKIVIGMQDDEFRTYEINKDPTNNIFIAIFSKQPLYEGTRLLQEDIEAYLPFLQRSLQQVGADGLASSYTHVLFNPR